jgi:hypothetical protein
VFALVWRSRRLTRSGHGPNGGGLVFRRGPDGHSHVTVEGGLAVHGRAATINTIGRDASDAELELRDGRLRVRRGLDRRFYDEAAGELRRAGRP